MQKIKFSKANIFPNDIKLVKMLLKVDGLHMVSTPLYLKMK